MHSSPALILSEVPEALPPILERYSFASITAIGLLILAGSRTLLLGIKRALSYLVDNEIRRLYAREGVPGLYA